MSFSSSLLTNQNCKENNSYILSHNQWSDAYNQPDISRAYASIKAFTSDLDNSEVTENLKKAVSDAENIDKSKISTEKYANLLNNQIEASKSLLSNSSCSVQDMNNAVILLKYYEEKAVDAPYEISSIDDYFTLIEICNNYGYIPEK